MFDDDFSGISLQNLLAENSWENRYKCLLQWSKLISHKEAIRSKENLVRGCALDVWLQHQVRGNKHYFAVDSDSRVVKGLAVLLLLQINGRASAEVSLTDITEVMQRLALQKHLSPSRNNGFKAMLDRAMQLMLAA